MLRKISVVQARRNLGQILEEVFYRGDQVILERSGRVMAVLVPPHLYEQWKNQREEDFQVFDQIRAKNTRYAPEEVEKEIGGAVMKLRRKQKAKATQMGKSS